MNSVYLRYFLVTAQLCNITQAAKAIPMTQQSLSRLIARMEEDIGTKLFVRTPNLELTDAGRCLMEFAQDIINRERALESQLQDLQGKGQGSLNIAIGSTRSRSFLPLVLPRYHKLYPHIRFKFFSGNSKQFTQMLNSREIDLFIGREYNVSNSNIDSAVLYTENTCVIISKSLMKQLFPKDYENKLIQFGKGVDIRWFKSVPYLLCSDCFIERHIINRLLAENEIVPKTVIEADDPEALIQLAFNGMGICFADKYLFSIVANQLKLEEVYCFPLDIPETTMIKTGLTVRVIVAYLKNHYLSIAAQNFIKVAQNVFRDEMQF